MERSRLFKFLMITFAITGIAWGGLAVLTKSGIISFVHPMATVLHIVGGFGPTIAALFVEEQELTVKGIIKLVFRHEKNSLFNFGILAIMLTATIGISSMELNPALPWYVVPIVFLQAVFVYGGEEELGWRGIMQPVLEEKMNFPIATLITGIVWGVWHIPLWFVEGSSQQNMAFTFFLVLAVILSFLLAALYKKTKCIFACCVFHGLINTLLSVFVIKFNLILVLGLIVTLTYSVLLWYHEDRKSRV